MEVASLSSLPVGVLAWNSPDPTCTVIVKATFDLGQDGYARLSPNQLPLSLDVPSRHGGEGIDYASDFAPRKRGVDVLVLGHARAAAAAQSIALSVTLGSMALHLHAMSETPSDHIPR